MKTQSFEIPGHLGALLGATMGAMSGGGGKGTTMPMHANEVVKLANASIEEIRIKRHEAVQEALKVSMERMCLHKVPFTNIVISRHPVFASREEAMERSSLVQHAKQWASGSEDNCKALRQMAEHLLSSDIKDEDRIMVISSRDFQDLTPMPAE